MRGKRQEVENIPFPLTSFLFPLSPFLSLNKPCCKKGVHAVVSMRQGAQATVPGEQVRPCFGHQGRQIFDGHGRMGRQELPDHGISLCLGEGTDRIEQVTAGAQQRHEIS